MGIIAVEGIVKKGQIRLEIDLNVPDHTKVYVIVPAQEAGEDSSQYPQREESKSFAQMLREVTNLSNIEKRDLKLSDFAGVGKELWSTIDVDAYQRLMLTLTLRKNATHGTAPTTISRRHENRRRHSAVYLSFSRRPATGRVYPTWLRSFYHQRPASEARERDRCAGVG